MAESEGFKPPVRTSRTADFESAPFDHSGNFPCVALFFSNAVQRYIYLINRPNKCATFCNYFLNCLFIPSTI